MGEQLGDILGHVEGSLVPAAGAMKNNSVNEASEITSTSAIVVGEEQHWDDDADAVYDEEYFDDTGTGAGVEGDLEMDED